MTFPQKIYLNIIAADNYPEQEPAYESATWWHVLWLLIPMIGIVLFMLSVEYSHSKNKNKCV